MKLTVPSPVPVPRAVANASARAWRRAVDGVKSRRGRRIVTSLLGVTGETLVTLGLVLGLFIAWELWWTDIGASRAQAEVVDGLGWEESPIDYSLVSVDPTTTESDDPIASVERTDPPAVMSQPAHATTFATMHVPRWGYTYVKPVSQGTDKKGVLDPLGIGHYNGSAMPGGWGNFAVAGHRTTYGKPFGRIEELVVGDAIVVRTKWVWYVYRVTSTEIVSPSNVGVIAPVPNQPGAEPNGRYLTLTTCHPKYSAAQRYIVHGEMAYWMPSISGTPVELIPPGEEQAPTTSPRVTPSGIV